MRAAMTFYGAGKYVDKVITIGSPNLPFTQIDALEDFVTNIADYQEWQEVGELLELGADVELHAGSVGFIAPSEPNTVKPYLDFLYQDDTIRLSKGGIKLSTIIDARKTILMSMMEQNDGFIPCSQQNLDFANRQPIIYASHSKIFEIKDIEINDTIPEYFEQYCTFLVEFIKHWMIDDTVILYDRNKLSSLSANFGFYPNEENPTSRSLRLLINSLDSYDDKTYNGIMAVVGTTLKENFDSRDDIGPTQAYDLTVLSENNRVSGQLSGSPLYTSFCGYDDKENDVYYSRVWLYDMNGYIFPDSGNMTIQHELDWGTATAPFVEITSSLPITKAFNSYILTWKSNDISAKCDLKIRNSSLGEYWLKNIALANLSYTYIVPPMSSGKGIAESKFKLRFHLDDYKNWIEDSIGSFTYTPDWNADSLCLVFQDEDSVKLAWKDTFHLRDIVFRDNSFIGGVSKRDTFVDKNFAFKTNYIYRVNSVYNYTSSDSIVSVNDNSSNYLSVTTTGPNAPKAYPIACIWQANDKSLLKWIDNS